MKNRVGAAVMAVLLLLYLGLVVQQAIRFISVDDGISKALGIALIVLPLLGLWALVAELQFGIRSQRLGAVVAAEGDLPRDTLPLRPSGRPERAAADTIFPRYREAVEREPESWRAWFRLGLAYDAAGDRRRARRSIRRAIALSRARGAAAG
jgi:tetratricopeptide (TPR) repeat protein